MSNEDNNRPIRSGSCHNSGNERNDPVGEASDLQSDDEVFEENSDDSVLYHTGALVPRPHRWKPNTVVAKPDSVLDYNNAKWG